MQSNRLGHIGFLSIYSCVVLFPFIWLILASFKTKAEFEQSPGGLPLIIGFDNYFTELRGITELR